MKLILALFFLSLLISNGNAANQEIYEAVSDVYVRAGIGTSNEIIGVLKAGEEVTVIDKTNPVWFKIETSSGSGYVSNKFLKFKGQLNLIPDNSSGEESDNVQGTSGSGLVIGFFIILLILLFFMIESSRNKKKKKLAISLIENSIRVQQKKSSQSKDEDFSKELEVDTSARTARTINIENKKGSLPLRPVSNFFTRNPEYDPFPQVPYWTDLFSFSDSGLENANEEQRKYYFKFKKKVLSGSFPDLRGNDNYAFVLVNDLLKDYDQHQNFNMLENQLLRVGAHYPKTKPYATGLLEGKRALLKIELGKSMDKVGLEKLSIFTNDSTGNPILDVTDDIVTPFQQTNKAKDSSYSVPLWSHRYIYSFADLEAANAEQKEFYYHFKQKFLEGVCLPVEGNTNYAFILLFDLLQSFEEHNDFEKLESQIKKLGNVYYKTRQYGIKFLNEIKRKKGPEFQVPETRLYFSDQRLPSQTTDYYSYPEYVYWKLGSKYQEKLGLNEQEVGLLNKLWESTNNFTSIEFCYIQTMRLYLDVLKKFEQACAYEDTSIEEVFQSIGDLVARFNFRYRKGSSNYNMSVRNTSDSLYAQIFKKCENELRERYGHKRKLSTDLLFSDPRIKGELESKILNPIALLLSDLIRKLPDPDEPTQVELNSLNSSRWKTEFDQICEKFESDPQKYLSSIVVLGELNRKNQSIENIFYDASKFIAPRHSESALILYLHYLYHDLKSIRFDNKPLTKTIQKSIFKSPEQVQRFESIVADFLQDKSLDKAVQAISSIFAITRKKIVLNKSSIEEVKQKHVGTVELLNEYLQEEVEDVFSKTELSPNRKELSFTISQGQSEVSKFVAEISFTEIHLQTLEYFVKNNFSVAIPDFEEFAKNQGVFKNQLIDSINEACFDVLDDVLIEEEGGYYTIETAYFQTISAK